MCYQLRCQAETPSFEQTKERQHLGHMGKVKESQNTGAKAWGSRRLHHRGYEKLKVFQLNIKQRDTSPYFH